MVILCNKSVNLRDLLFQTDFNYGEVLNPRELNSLFNAAIVLFDSWLIAFNGLPLYKMGLKQMGDEV